MRKYVSLMAGAFLGAIVGSTLVLLLTPESGKDLRSQIVLTWGRARDEVRQAALDKRKELEAQLTTLRRGRGNLG